MADRNKEAETARSEATKARAGISRRGVAWIVVAFGFLVVGLVGGTILSAWKRELAWVFPAASFVGYLLAFRHGLLLWNPNVDRTWRRCLWLEREMFTEDESVPAVTEHPEKTLKIVRPETPRPPRHELRVIR